MPHLCKKGSITPLMRYIGLAIPQITEIEHVASWQLQSGLALAAHVPRPSLR